MMILKTHLNIMSCKRIIAVALLVFLFLPIRSNAMELEYNFTEEYLNWINADENEKESLPIPQMTSAILKDNKRNFENWNEEKEMMIEVNSIGNSIANNSKFNLLDYINIKIENQEDTMECWAFSTLTSMESNLLYKKGINKDFSERHMDYATSSSFSDKTVEDSKYVRKVDFGAVPEIALAYLSNGQGAVYEEQMPFENNVKDILYNDINIKPSYYVTNYRQFPSIMKQYNSDGTVKYYDAYKNLYSNQDVKNIRQQIKDYIVNNGAVTSVTASKYISGYSRPDNPTLSKAFCCKDSSQIRDHAVTIIGWDDNYSKENFNKDNKPVSDGAYIVLQSYGEKNFDKGIMYISYEDCLIENSIYGICDSKEYDYDNLYQNDYYGSNGILSLNGYKTGYIATVFDRDKTKSEVINQISFNLPERAKVEIYINPNDSEVSTEKIIKVADSKEILEPGYHTINIKQMKLKNDKFVVVIKQTSESGNFHFNIEFKADTRFYAKVESKLGRNFVSIDGKKWNLLNDLSKDDLINTADLCIKAYTKENVEDFLDENEKNTEENKNEGDKTEEKPDENIETKIESKIYKIDGNYIKNIECPTKLEDFFKWIEIQAKKIEMYNDKVKIDLKKNTKELLKTGMKLIIDDKEYYIVVKGDLNCDGKISLIDLSKLLAHYAELKDCQISGFVKEAGDMNIDGKISLIDLSKLLEIYSKL